MIPDPMSDEALLKRLYNAFDPLRPLPAGDPAYVNCQDVRGDGNILIDLGKTILNSDRSTCQLYAGHRGAGKSTELLRLEKYLTDKGCFVVYFPADEADLDAQNTEYTDILMATTRHLLDKLKHNADPLPVVNWLKERWTDLKGLMDTKFEFDAQASVDLQIIQFAKLTATLKAIPGLRQEIRAKLNPHTTTLTEALNGFVKEAKHDLPNGASRLVVIADNLDRITPVIQADGRSSHDHIFIDSHEQLKSLDCHVIYTVPISMVYSERISQLRDLYGTDAEVLPMVMVRTEQNAPYEAGVSRLKDLMSKRVYEKAEMPVTLGLETQIFEQPEVLDRLCWMSGGYVRELMYLIRDAINRTDTLPISIKAVRRVISEARNTYRTAVYDDQWLPLARVHRAKTAPNDELHRNFLFNRCIFEYRCVDAEDNVRCWYDVHPLIAGIAEFEAALAKVGSHEPSTD